MFSKLRGLYKRYLYDDNVFMPDRSIITNTINFSNQDEDDEEDQIITIPPTTSTCDLSFEAEDGDDV